MTYQVHSPDLAEQPETEGFLKWRDDNSACWLSIHSENIYVNSVKNISQKPIENNPSSVDNIDQFCQKLDYDATEFDNNPIYQIAFQY